MADRQWFSEGVAVYESGTEEYFVEGVGLSESVEESGPAEGSFEIVQQIETDVTGYRLSYGVILLDSETTVFFLGYRISVGQISLSSIIDSEILGYRLSEGAFGVESLSEISFLGYRSSLAFFAAEQTIDFIPEEFNLGTLLKSASSEVELVFLLKLITYPKYTITTQAVTAFNITIETVSKE